MVVKVNKEEHTSKKAPIVLEFGSEEEAKTVAVAIVSMANDGKLKMCVSPYNTSQEVIDKLLGK